MNRTGETLEQELHHMDRLTQTQDAIDELLTIMYSTITYLTTKGSFKQVSEALPITQTIPGRDDPATYEARRKELALDLLKKAKQLEILITHFPSATEADQHFEAQYEGLQSELRSVKQEYEQELQHAESLQAQLDSALDAVTSAPIIHDTQA